MTLRTKAIILSVVFIGAFVVLSFVDITKVFSINQEITKSIAVSLLFAVGLYWVLGFNFKGIRYITIIGYSAFIVFILSLFFQLIVFQNTQRISAQTFSVFILIVFGLITYFLILTINILNISYISRIPLAQAAKASNFLYTLFTSYFSFLLLLRTGVDEIVKILLFTLVILLLTLNLFWFKKEARRQLIGETLSVVLFMSILFAVLMMWPLPVEVSSMFFTIVFYILLGLGLEDRETTSVLMRIEYAVILLVALFFLLKLSVWGINGPIL